MTESLKAPELAMLSAADAAQRLQEGSLSAVDYARALLERVDQVEPQVKAWAHLDRDLLLRQADDADDERALGKATGPLFGLPVGVKDIIDTADHPTEHGTVLHAGRQPHDDAWVIRALRAAGGLVMGKTVTTELATYAPGPTTNPHHAGHTPGGSSSGSAAAVAAGMVPLAIGTQTNGSVIRPASFCGVVGYKPSSGLVPRTGVLTQSPSFDCVGFFARSVADVAMLAECLIGDDPADPATRPRARPALRTMAESDPPLPPTLAFVATPFWNRMAPDAQAAFGELQQALAGRIAPFELPAAAAEVEVWLKQVMEAEIAGSMADEYARGKDLLSPSLRSQIERGCQLTAVQHRQILARIPMLRAALDEVFDHYDAVVTPATLGTAPEGLKATGDPIMCTIWSFLGLPALSLPLLHGANGLPLGVQLVGRHGQDAKLMRTARWLTQAVQQASQA